jgi:small-conductance mechanosensitive channel
MNLNKTLFGDVTLLDLAIATAVLLVAVILAKGVQIYVRRTLADRLRGDQVLLITKILYYSILTVAILVVLSILGVDPSGLLVAGGIAGIVLGFASQSIVANLISGLFLLFERPVKIGEAVSIGDVAGFVEDINIISTTIRQFDGLFVRIPNEKVFTANITNFVSHAVRRFEYMVGIRYSDDADQAIEIIKRVIDEEPFALKEPPPQAFVDSLGDNAVVIMVRIWAPVSEWFSLRMKMLWLLKKALEAEGIEIAFPQRVVWFGDREPGQVQNGLFQFLADCPQK